MKTIQDSCKSNKTAAKKTVSTCFVGTLDRFGYDLIVVSDTEDGARKALMAEYRRTYKKINKSYPSKEEIDSVNDDIFVRDAVLNQVYWD